MKFYLAAQYSRKLEIQRFAEHLQSLGHVITSTWTSRPTRVVPQNTTPFKDPGSFADEAADDVREIRECDVLLLFSESPLLGIPRGCRHVESGIAIGCGKRVIVIGPHENIFHCLREITVVANFQELLEIIASDAEIAFANPEVFEEEACT